MVKLNYILVYIGLFLLLISCDNETPDILDDDINDDTLEEALAGCMDSNACNYNESASEDDESCIYPEENLDCEGSCTLDIDCNDECGGTAVIDECGVCSGPGILEGDCDCNGNQLDECGICGGEGPSLECGCADISEGDCDCNGNQLDECNVCGGDGISEDLCDCSGTAKVCGQCDILLDDCFDIIGIMDCDENCSNDISFNTSNKFRDSCCECHNPDLDSFSWDISISAILSSNIEIFDDGNKIGVNNTYTQECDTDSDMGDVVENPNVPPGSYIQFYFPHSDWICSSLGNNFTQDMRSSFDLDLFKEIHDGESWDFEIYPFIDSCSGEINIELEFSLSELINLNKYMFNLIFDNSSVVELSFENSIYTLNHQLYCSIDESDHILSCTISASDCTISSGKIVVGNVCY